jgi:hypothetical protein
MEKWIVKRTSFQHETQYIAEPGVWQPDINQAQQLPLNEARWLAFTNSSKQQPARAIPAPQ